MEEKTKKWAKPLAFLLTIVAGAAVLGIIFDQASEHAQGDDVNRVHAVVEKCQECHQPIDEVRPANCARAGCHTSNFFRDRMEKADSPLYQHIMRRDCTTCHTEHQGKDGDITYPFDHTDAMAETCNDCHMMPDIHPDTADTCQDCHTAQSFADVQTAE